MEKGNQVFVRNMSNNLTLSGLIVEKPIFKEIKRLNGQISKWCCFYLTQNLVGFQNKIYTKKFFCISRSPEIIDELKTYDRQVYVTCLGKLDYVFGEHRKAPTYQVIIEEMHIEALCDEKMIVERK